jgi:hypothetical protein
MVETYIPNQQKNSLDTTVKKISPINFLEGGVINVQKG